MAQFPSSVANDSNLYVAVNSLATTLVGALTSSGGNYSPTEIQVSDTTGFPTSGFITIDTEAISYTGISAGPARFTGISRGADGTIASAHGNGTAVKHNVIAAHHNVLKEEVKAIEQNLSDRIGLHATQVVLQANQNANSFKITGLAAGSTNGDSVRYEQVVFNSGDQSISGIKDFTGQFKGKGTATNDNASAGYIGEYVESASTSTVNHVNSQYTNYVSISLTAGDWDVTGLIQHRSNSATGVSEFDTVISVNSGNTQTDHVLGKNLVYNIKTYSTTEREMQMVPVYRLSLSSTTTVYLKGLVSVTSGTPTMNAGCISARRVR